MGMATDMVCRIDEASFASDVPTSTRLDLPWIAGTDSRGHRDGTTLDSTRDRDIQRSAAGCHSQTRNIRNSGFNRRIDRTAAGCHSGTEHSRYSGCWRGLEQRKPFSLPHTPFHIKRNSRRFNARTRGTINFSRSPGMGKCHQRNRDLLWRRTLETRAHREVARQGEEPRSTGRGPRVRLASPCRAQAQGVRQICYLPAIQQHLGRERVETRN